LLLLFFLGRICWIPWLEEWCSRHDATKSRLGYCHEGLTAATD
jgi:hypothetical protein